jgi:hypothetical protein
MIQIKFQNMIYLIQDQSTIIVHSFSEQVCVGKIII